MSILLPLGIIWPLKKKDSKNNKPIEKLTKCSEKEMLLYIGEHVLSGLNSSTAGIC